MPNTAPSVQTATRGPAPACFSGRPGKIEIHATKPLDHPTRPLARLFAGCRGAVPGDRQVIADLVYDYTAKGSLVAVISNGSRRSSASANLGALASKPVMEGKAVLFKRFADIDGIDLEVDTQDVDEFVNCVRFLGRQLSAVSTSRISRRRNASSSRTAPARNHGDPGLPRRLARYRHHRRRRPHQRPALDRAASLERHPDLVVNGAGARPGLPAYRTGEKHGGGAVQSSSSSATPERRHLSGPRPRE